VTSGTVVTAANATIPKDSLTSEATSTVTPYSLSPTGSFTGSQISFSPQSLSLDPLTSTGNVGTFVQLNQFLQLQEMDTQPGIISAPYYLNFPAIPLSFAGIQICVSFDFSPNSFSNFQIGMFTSNLGSGATTRAFSWIENFISGSSAFANQWVPLRAQFVYNASFDNYTNGFSVGIWSSPNTGSPNPQFKNVYVSYFTTPFVPVSVVGNPTGTVSTLSPVTPSGSISISTLSGSLTSNSFQTTSPTVTQTLPVAATGTTSGEIYYNFPNYTVIQISMKSSLTVGALLQGTLRLNFQRSGI